MKRAGWLVLSVLLMASAGRAGAAYSFDNVTRWVGTGSQRAALVVDWYDGSTHSVQVWGYRFDGVKTGRDMLQDIAGTGTGLALTERFYTGMGWMLASLGYGSLYLGNGSSDPWPYWTYWTGTDSPYAGGSWSESGAGYGDRELADGSWDGWAYAPQGWGSQVAPFVPQAVPEPATMALLLSGLPALAFAARRRRCR